MAGKIAEVREAIYEAFIAGWAGYSPVCLDNEKFTPPTASLWVRVSVRHLSSSQESMGGISNRRFERAGLIIVQVFAPLDAGGKTIDDAVQKVRDIFEGTRIIAGGDVRVNALEVRELGPLEGWNQTNAEAHLTYVETR